MNKQSITSEISSFVHAYQKTASRVTRWNEPLVGFASADDPLFPELKRVVSMYHLLPEDIVPGALTAVAYLETNTLIEETGIHMKQFIESKGFETAAMPATKNFDKQKLISNWSHRHIAYIAGLGKFGLNNMLITNSGCCGRYGSFVTTLELPAGSRSDKEACLYKHNRSCKRCVTRCVGNALFTDRFDRHACYKLCLENVDVYRLLGDATVCGKCLTDVPCSFEDPVVKGLL